MFPLATPLGVKSHKTGVVMLNPADDYVLMAGWWTGLPPLASVHPIHCSEGSSGHINPSHIMPSQEVWPWRMS